MKERKRGKNIKIGKKKRKKTRLKKEKEKYIETFFNYSTLAFTS